MIGFTNRFKAVMLMLTLLVAGQASALSLPTWLPTMPAMPAWAPSKKQAFGFLVIAMWIRLQSKGTSFDYKASDWENDIRDLMTSLNLFDAQLYVKLVKLFDKWCVGRKLEIVDKTTRTREDNGSVVTVKGKKVHSTPFGALGLFDAYVIGMLEKVGNVGLNIDKFQNFTRPNFGIDFYVTIDKAANKQN